MDQPGTRPRAHGHFLSPELQPQELPHDRGRLFDFPLAIEPILENPSYRLYESPRIGDELILEVHTPELLKEVRRDPLCSTGWHSAGGVVLAAEMIARGEIRNAFAFIGAGGHHSGGISFGGHCCFNDVALAVHVLRKRYGWKRFAILDTDAHHGDGTRELLAGDPGVLHVCFARPITSRPTARRWMSRRWAGTRGEAPACPKRGEPGLTRRRRRGV